MNEICEQIYNGFDDIKDIATMMKGWVEELSPQTSDAEDVVNGIEDYLKQLKQLNDEYEPVFDGLEG